MSSPYDLGPLAEKLGRYMAEQCVDGVCGHFGDELVAAMGDVEPSVVKLALAELQAEGLVTLSPVIGPHLPHVRTTVQLFIACDAAITGQDPVADSVVLARLLIDSPQLGGNARDLEEASGWERRRFNPAFALLVSCIADGRVRKAIQDQYPVMGVIAVEEDVVELRRYVREHTR